MNRRGIILDNIPNFLTIMRVVLTFVVAYMIFNRESLVSIVIVFSVAALTDWFDGRLARRFKWESEFGRKADMIADRFLWIGTAIAIIVSFGIDGMLTWREGLQIGLILVREMISAPFAIIAFFSGDLLPKARYIAKVTTFVQGFALPSVLISVYYPVFSYISWPLAIVCAVTGFYSALYYMNDVNAPTKSGKKRK